MPQDHPAPVSGERGTHRRLTGCRDLPRYAPDCIHPADPGCPQRVTAKGNSPSSPDAYRRCPSPSIPVWPGPSPIPVSRYSSRGVHSAPVIRRPGVHSAPVVRRPGAPSVPVIRRPPPGGVFFCGVAARDRDLSTRRTFYAAVGSLRCHIVPALCQKPPSCVISRKMPVFGNTAFFAPLQNPGFQRGFLAFWLSNAAFPPGNGGRLQFCDPDAAFRATRPARWFDSVPPGGFAVFDGEMLSKRCFSSALFPIPNYFYEIVAKIVRVVIK